MKGQHKPCNCNDIFNLFWATGVIALSGWDIYCGKEIYILDDCWGLYYSLSGGKTPVYEEVWNLEYYFNAIEDDAGRVV